MPSLKKKFMRRFAALRFALTVLLLIALNPLSAFSALHIMPLGDSITYGSYGTYGGYRGYLYDQLISAHYDFLFVGSRSDNSPGTIDPYHEGHPGWRAEEVRDNVLRWLLDNPAEVVLLHIGTNDLARMYDGLSESVWKSQVQVQVNEVGQILDRIDDFSENTVVILAQIISTTNADHQVYTTYFNQRLKLMAQARTNDTIIITDMENGAGLVYSTASGGDLADYLHPNNRGYEKMADRWFAAINSYDFNSNCRLDSRFQTDVLELSLKYYTDRDYTLTNVPAHYRGMDTIKTPNDDRNRIDASGYLKFKMPYDATVYVAYDSRASRLPDWMNGFVYTGETLQTSLSTQPYLKIYGKPFRAGACVNLGGNKGDGFSGDTVSNYLVFYGVAGAPPACILDPKFDQVTLISGTRYYTDRDYVLTGVPTPYQGMKMIATPNDERSRTDASNYLKFEMPFSGKVYVAYDSRATSLPYWLRSFTYTGYNVSTSLSSQPYLKVYSKSYAGGDCVNLGANKADGYAGDYSTYIVFYGVDVAPPACMLAPKFDQDLLATGLPYYTDRNYVLTSVPAPFSGMEAIMTPNDDANRTDASNYLTFEMPYDGTVYVAYDSRATNLPLWLRTFSDTGYKIYTSLATQPYLKVYAKQAAADTCVNLGGNKASGFAGSTVSNYLVFYGLGGTPSACVLDPKFKQTVLAAGTQYYTDRDYVLTGVPASYQGMKTVTTPNDERSRTDASNYLKFTMPANGSVYVAYDSRATSLPYWLQSFTDTGAVLDTSLSTQPGLKIYRKAFNAGDCVNLGANKADGYGGDYSTYIVFYG
ncbi:MAG: SGNH/GDSL hydrolase family protein [Desulfobacterales bacterium]